jgi:isopentenyldiphosphate isomerase
MVPDEEFLDIVDSRGNATGIRKPRAQIHHDGDWHRTVHIWLMKDYKELLLQCRAASKESFPGYWDVSIAGHVRAGDVPIIAAQKEAEEELGIALALEQLEFLFAVRMSSVLNEGTFIDNEVADVYLVDMTHNACCFRLSAEEVSAVRWFGKQQIQAMLCSSQVLIVPHHEEYQGLFRLLERHCL